MKNLVDLHAHVLPGLDDGPDELPESLRMLETLEALGFRHVFATPHHRLYSWVGIDPETVQEEVMKLSKAARESGISVNLLPGMEFDLDETLPERASFLAGEAGHVLVDVGFWGVPKELSRLLGTLQDSGAEVLLVHPERNRELCRNRRVIRGLLASGVRLLGNIGSFSGMYGHSVRRDARDLLKEGLYWAVASDMHSPDQSHWIRAGMDQIQSLVGSPAATELMETRPMQMVWTVEGDA